MIVARAYIVCCKKLTKFPKNAIVRFIGEFSGILKDDHKKVQKCNRPCYFWGNFFQVQKMKKIINRIIYFPESTVRRKCTFNNEENRIIQFEKLYKKLPHTSYVSLAAIKNIIKRRECEIYV